MGAFGPLFFKVMIIQIVQAKKALRFHSAFL